MDLVSSAIEPIKLIAETVYELFMKEKANQEQCQRLAKCIKALVQTLDSLRRQDLSARSAELRERLDELKATLEAAEALLHKREATSKFKKLLKAHKTNDKLEALFQQLSDEHGQLQLLLQVEQREVAGATIVKVDGVQERVDETLAKVSIMHNSVDSAIRVVSSVDEKMSGSQKQMEALQDKVVHSQNSIDALNEKFDQLIKGGSTAHPSPNPGPEVPSAVDPKPNPEVPRTPAVTSLAQEADKLLAQIRSRFVEKVSLPLIKQLLDDLQEERVLNSEEAESVLEEQSARTDRARCLIDMVRKKGRKASEKMITCLRQRDPSLTESLGVA